jgi:hypothetical protein
VIAGLEITGGFTALGTIDVLNFVCFVVASGFYEVIGIQIFVRLRKMEEKRNQSQKSVSKMEVVQRTARILLFCGAFMIVCTCKRVLA